MTSRPIKPQSDGVSWSPPNARPISGGRLSRPDCRQRVAPHSPGISSSSSDRSGGSSGSGGGSSRRRRAAASGDAAAPAGNAGRISIIGAGWRSWYLPARATARISGRERSGNTHPPSPARSAALRLFSGNWRSSSNPSLLSGMEDI